MAYERKDKLILFERLRLEGCSENSALMAVAYSRPTYYRWKKAYQEKGCHRLENRSHRPLNNRKLMSDKRTEQHVLQLRQKFKLWAKLKIATILKREHQVFVSASTVGRILNKLISLGKIKPVRFFYEHARAKKRRSFKGHSQKWTKHLKRNKPGDMIQIDHMSICPAPEYTYKEFKAVCPISKVVFAELYFGASAKSAKDFILKLKDQLPFGINSIHVDGGSEFRTEFE